MSENKSVKLSFDVAGGDFERAGEASSKIKKMLQRLGIPADIVRRIAIGTYEAEMNVIIHAGGGNVAAEVFPDNTVIEVSDHGPGRKEDGNDTGFSGRGFQDYPGRH